MLFAIYNSELIKWVEQYVLASEGLSFLDDLDWVVIGNHFNLVVTIPERCPVNSIERASREGLQLKSSKTEAAPFIHSCGHKNTSGIT